MSPFNFSEDYIATYGTYNPNEVSTTESIEVTCETNLEDKKFKGSVGKIFRVKCPSCKGVKSNVFGSFIYHPKSAICSSALHSDTLEVGGGYVIVELVHGKEIYNGSLGGHEIISTTFNKAQISFRTKKATPPTKISCLDSPAKSPFSTATIGTKFVIVCPKKCSEHKSDIFGTEIYTDQSSICLAGIHSGHMSDLGGETEFVIEAGQSNYSGSKSFGVISKVREAYVRSFKFLGPKTAIYFKFKDDFLDSIDKKYKINAPTNTKDDKWQYANLEYLDKETNLNKKVMAIHHKGNAKGNGSGDFGTFIKLKDVEFNNGIIQANLFFKETDVFAFLFRYLDKRNFYTLEFEPLKLNDNVRLVARVNGNSKIVGNHTQRLNLLTWYRLSIIMENDKITVFIQTDNIRENKPVFETNIGDIARGTIGFASNGNDDTYINGISIDQHHPHALEKKNLKNKRSWIDYLKHVDTKHIKVFCKNTFKQNDVENASCRQPINFCRMKCDDYIPTIENILNFNCFKDCTTKMIKQDSEVAVKKIEWKPSIGDRVDFKSKEMKDWAAGTIISATTKGDDKNVDVYTISYITPEGETKTNKEEFPSPGIKKCGEELPKRKDCTN